VKNLLALEATVAGIDVQPVALIHSKFRSYNVDVRDEEAITKAVEEVCAAFNKIDGLVTSAGVFSSSKPFYEMGREEWERVVSTNLTGTFLCAKHVARRMVQSGSGKIVTIGCIRSAIVSPSMADYAASKGGVAALTAAMASDLARYNIQVNSVAPGFTMTGMTQEAYQDPQVRRRREEMVPLGRIAIPEDIARVVVLLLSEQADYMTGQTVFVDGGFTKSR
jgi:NAD(P)-dependent dehydrogenase (short-subunit alcohol dehydrogenase family)